jgi:hypothetical protein
LRGRIARLRRLELRDTPDGACTACGLRPDDIRTVFVGCAPTREEIAAGWEPPPLVEPDPPDRPVCELCGLDVGAIAFVELDEAAASAPGLPG